MKIATFNINGIKARLPALLDWLQEAKPDVALLQEIKSVDENFPAEPIEDLGYSVHTHGQKSFNGVAILSRLPVEDVTRGLPGDEEDEQARYIEATIIGDQAVRVCGLYLPNGNPAPGPKYDYKLAWMKRLKARAEELLLTEEPVVMAGDYNVIPQREDADRPDAWRDDALFLPQTRAAFRELLYLGFTEAFRARDPAPLNYTRSGTIRPVHGTRMTGSASTICCSRRTGRRPDDGLPDRPGCARAAKSRLTMCRSGSISLPSS